MSVGLAPSEFWSATPREVAAIQKGAVARIEREAQHDRHMVYAQAVLNRSAWRAKRMPRFDEVFRAPRQKQSAQEMMSAMRAWTAALAVKEGENGG